MDSKSVTYPDFYGPGEAQTLTFDGLNTILGGDSYASRDGDWTLYYDPSGSYHTYTIQPYSTGTNKLFVFHIGGRAQARVPPRRAKRHLLVGPALLPTLSIPQPRTVRLMASPAL